MMTLEECYEKLGGDYEDVSGRLPSAKLIEKFMGKFLEDESFSSLCEAFEAQNKDEVFRMAHTLKGVCGNLGFSRLMKSSSILTEAFRDGKGVFNDETAEMLEQVKTDYHSTTDSIMEYQKNC